MRPRLIVLVFVLMVALAGVGLLFYLQSQQSKNVILASGTIETTDIQVGSRLGGRIIAVEADEGYFVKPNQILLRLDPYQVPGQEAALKAQLNQAQQHLQELIAGPRPQEIATARAQYLSAQQQADLKIIGNRPEDIAQARDTLKQAQADLQIATVTYQRYKRLVDQQMISRQDFDTAQANYQNNQAKVSAAEQHLRVLIEGNRPQEIAAAVQDAKAKLEQLRLLEAGTRPEQISQQKSMIQNLEAQLQQLHAVKRELDIRSPCNCQVDSLDLKPGQLIMPNQTVASLTNLDDLWVRVYIPEERFGQVQPGDTAQVSVDAFPHKVFAGKVLQLNSRAEFTPRNVQTQETRKILVFGVKVGLDNRERFLRPGMPADVSFTNLHTAQHPVRERS